MDLIPPSGPPRAVVISGITIDFAENQVKHALLIKLSVDGADTRSVQLIRKKKQNGVHPLKEPLTLRDGSILSIQVLEQHRLQPNKTLAKPNLSLNSLLTIQEPNGPEIDHMKYRIELPDANQRIWLNIATVTVPSQTSSNNTDGTLQATHEVADNPRAKNDLEDAVQKLKAFKSTLDRLGPAKGPVDTALKLGGAVAELNTIAKIVVASVRIVYDEIKIQDQHHKEMLSLAENMDQMLTFIPTVSDVARLEELKNIIRTFSDLMDDTVDFIGEWLGSKKSQFLYTSRNRDKIENLRGRYQLFEKAFDRGVAADNAIKLDNVSRFQELQELEAALGGIKGVNPRANPCMEGTRTRILYNVESDIDDLNGKNVVWVRGAPGTGKSAVSLTIKSRLHEQGRLVTYFRFDRNDANITTSRALWCRVAYDLAKRYPSLLEYHLSLLRENKVNLTSTIDLFTSLISNPLSDTPSNHPIPSDRPLVIVIDALDECGGFDGHSSPDRRALQETLKRWPRLPRYLKLLVTSRPEGDIIQVLSNISMTIDIPSGHSLAENPEGQVSVDTSEDIRTFLESRFQDIRERLSSLPTDWPGGAIIARMIRRAAGNFMWATTASIFIQSGLDPEEQLDKIMDSRSESMGMKGLYSLYSTILETSFRSFPDDDLNILRAVLGTVVFAQRPLQDIEYAGLPTKKLVKLSILETIRDHLRSVIDPGPTLRFVHKSFDDFLLSENCPPKYRICIAESHHLLTGLCLKKMMKELRFNICGLETSCSKNGDIPDIITKVADGISPLLSYSCCYWADHLSHTTFNEQLLGQVRDMVYDKLLYWFEAMSLLKEINRVSPSLLSVLSWAKPASDREFDDFIRDGHRFIGAFCQVITQSAPHIYISALPFAPERSPVAKHFLPRFPRILTVSVGKPTDWSPCVFTSEHNNDQVCSVAFSPDEKYFLSGSGDGSACICDCETGNLTSGPFRTLTVATRPSFFHSVSSFFDPDGQHVWAYCHSGRVTCWDIATGDKHVDFRAGGWCAGCCCSNGGKNIICICNGAVKLWNADTGELVNGVLDLPHDSPLSMVSFSPDGCYLAWADHDDTTIRIWNLGDGNEIHGSQSQPHHEQAISALSFSVDGHYAVSGSRDGNILIWNAITGDVTGHPLATGNRGVRAVAYSHKNAVLVSASWKPGVLMVWNTSTHQALLGPLEGHTGYITAIALSRDGRRALSASRDKTVRMWDLEREGVVPVTSPFEGHTTPVRCLTFSPCGQKLASLEVDDWSMYNARIKVWDMGTDEPLLSLIGGADMEGNYKQRPKLIFTPDSSQIIAFNGALMVWNVHNSGLIFVRNLDGDRDFVHSAFRSTDQRFITCSRNAVRIWTFEDDGSLREGLFASTPQPENPNKPVEIIALSPDGQTVIVCDDNRTPRHYIWNTITCQPLPITFADDEHMSNLTFSPSGSFAAASNGPTLRVWNIQTGELAVGPLPLNGWLTCIAFSPSDSHVALSYTSGDLGAIWIWNVRTGRLAFGPWQAHTSHVTALAFSPDGGKLVSGSGNGQIRIWNTTDLLGAPHPHLCVWARMKDGWVTREDGEFLFWVPVEHRERLVLPRVVAVMGGSGIHAELDLTRFRYGRDWTECFRE